MYLDPLLRVIESFDQANWYKRNEEALAALFGRPDGRYPKAAAKTVSLRAPGMDSESGVPFAAYIHPTNPGKGPYGGMSFVVFPVPGEGSLIGLVTGTQGLAPDEAVLGRPGHARKAQAICAWLNREFGKGTQVAWAKQDPTQAEIPVPEELRKKWSAFKDAFEKYGKVMYALFKPDANSKAAREAVTAFL